MSGSVRKRGDKWYYSFETAKVGGRRRRIERVGGRTKKEAESALRKALEEYENTGRHFEPSTMSLSDYLDYWYEQYVEVNCRYNTRYCHKLLIKNHIKPSIGGYRLSSITTATMQDFVNAKYKEGIGRASLSRVVVLLSAAFRYAVQPCGFIKSSPVDYVRIPKFAQYVPEERTALTEDEITRIFKRYTYGDVYYMPLVIGYHTGMRIGEVTGLTWDDVDFERMTISVSKILLYIPPSFCFTPPKTKSSIRTIRIGKTLRDILARHKTDQAKNRLYYGKYYTNHYINPNKTIISTTAILNKPKADFICTRPSGEFVGAKSFRHASDVINKQLGIKFNFHLLRHTHATRLIENGANIKDVQSRLGHASIRVTLDTYTHVTPKMSDETVDIFEGCLRG